MDKYVQRQGSGLPFFLPDLSVILKVNKSQLDACVQVDGIFMQPFFLDVNHFLVRLPIPQGAFPSRSVCLRHPTYNRCGGKRRQDLSNRLSWRSQQTPLRISVLAQVSRFFSAYTERPHVPDITPPHCTAAALTFLVWDTLITLDDEVRPSSLSSPAPSFLFLCFLFNEADRRFIRIQVEYFWSYVNLWNMRIQPKPGADL